MVRTPSRDDRDRSLKSAFLNVWTVIGCVIIFLIVLNLLGLLSGTLLFLAVGCISAFIASPLVNWLERHRVPRAPAPFWASWSLSWRSCCCSSSLSR